MLMSDIVGIFSGKKLSQSKENSQLCSNGSHRVASTTLHLADDNDIHYVLDKTRQTDLLYRPQGGLSKITQLDIPVYRLEEKFKYHGINPARALHVRWSVDYCW